MSQDSAAWIDADFECSYMFILSYNNKKKCQAVRTNNSISRVKEPGISEPNSSTDHQLHVGILSAMIHGRSAMGFHPRIRCSWNFSGARKEPWRQNVELHWVDRNGSSDIKRFTGAPILLWQSSVQGYVQCRIRCRAVSNRTESTVLHVFKLQAPSESILNHVGLSGDRVPQHLVVSWLISITFSLTRHLFFDSPFCGQNPVEYPLNLRRWHWPGQVWIKC